MHHSPSKVEYSRNQSDHEVENVHPGDFGLPA